MVLAFCFVSVWSKGGVHSLNTHKKNTRPPLYQRLVWQFMSVWLCKVRSYELCVCSSRVMCSPRRLCELLHVKCVNSSSRVSNLDFLQINTSMLHYF